MHMDNEDICPRCGKEWEIVDNYHFSNTHWQEHMLCYHCGYDEIQDITRRRIAYIDGKWIPVKNNWKPQAGDEEQKED